MLIKSKKRRELLEKLAEIVEQRKELEKAERELKSEAKTFLPVGESCLAGTIVASLTEKTRTSVDTKLLVEKLGDKAAEFMKQTTYTQVDIKRVA